MMQAVDVDRILPFVRKPGRYIGGELHAASSAWPENSLKFCLIFPDLYEIGMSHQGLQILYHILNARPRVLAHRCYAPDLDMEDQLRTNGVPLFSLESRMPLNAYDVLGITLPYELCYTNILTILDLGGVPLLASERGEEHPLVVGGGSCSFNPEPVADFFDAIVIGDGEEAVVELAESIAASRAQGKSRQETLDQLASITGLYLPGRFRPIYQGGSLVGVEALNGEHSKVRRRILAELQPPEQVAPPIVPVVKPVHDRLGLEIARGCTRGCRFCQAGTIYRPVRERNLNDIFQLAEQGITDSGFEELALLSLSTGDYSCIGELLTGLMDRFADDKVAVSMPSMRVGTLTSGIMEEIKRVRKTGFTVAPEAGTDRLRRVINKGITEEDLLETCRDAFSLGWKLIKFYFMVGLPTETEEDVQAIIDLARKARLQSPKGQHVQINVSIAIFVPKPHTAFQWHRQLSFSESQATIDYLKKHLPRKGFTLKWHDPRMSLLEGVFSRGDRKLGRLIESAWRRGARFDGWAEHYSLETWQEAAIDAGIDLESYLRERGMEEVLPWDHIDCGVERQFLEAEMNRARQLQYTPDCREHGCQQCGLCDFKEIKPRRSLPATIKEEPGPESGKTGGQLPPAYAYRVAYSRMGDSRFYGHLELLQLIFRALNRAGLPVRYSQGYNPTPKVSFSPALGVGVESLAEFFDVELDDPLAAVEETILRLNDCLPEWIRVHSMVLTDGRVPELYRFRYAIRLSSFDAADLDARIDAFLGSAGWEVERRRKNRTRKLDIRPLVERLARTADGLELDLISYNAKAGTNPREILELVLGISSEKALLARIVKLSCEEELRP